MPISVSTWDVLAHLQGSGECALSTGTSLQTRYVEAEVERAQGQKIEHYLIPCFLLDSVPNPPCISETTCKASLVRYGFRLFWVEHSAAKNLPVCIWVAVNWLSICKTTHRHECARHDRSEMKQEGTQLIAATVRVITETDNNTRRN